MTTEITLDSVTDMDADTDEDVRKLFMDSPYLENDTYWYYNETFENDTRAEEIYRRPTNFGPPCQLVLTPRLIVLIVCFTIIFTLSVIGNCLVIVTIAQNRWMRTVTNIFLQSLAISDLLLSVVCMPPTLTAMLFQCFLWGQAMCKLISYLQPVSVAASAYTLVAIALERYNAICRPLQSRHWKTKSHAIKMIVAVWVISLLCSSPALFMYNSVELRPGQWNCRDDQYGPDVSGFYYLFQLLVFFVVPLVLMIGLYSAVTYTLWMGIKLDSTPSNGDSGSPERSSICEQSMRKRVIASKPAMALRRFGKSIRDRTSGATASLISRSTRQSTSPEAGTQKSPSSVDRGDAKTSITTTNAPILRSTHSAKNLEAKKRVIIMLFVIVVEFVVCWSPLFSYLALFQLGYIRHVDLYLYTFLVVLSYLSSCSNPITYCFLNLKFRQAFLLAFGCRFLVKDAPLLYQNAHIPHRHAPNVQNQHRCTPIAEDHSKENLDEEHELHNTKRAIDSLVIQCKEPPSLTLPLLRLRNPSLHSHADDQNHNHHRDDFESEDDDDLMISESQLHRKVAGRADSVPATVKQRVGNGNLDFVIVKANKNQSPCRRVQEKLTTV